MSWTFISRHGYRKKVMKIEHGQRAICRKTSITQAAVQGSVYKNSFISTVRLTAHTDQTRERKFPLKIPLKPEKFENVGFSP